MINKSSPQIGINQIDRLICRPLIGIPLFFVIIFSIFFLTFDGLGNLLTKFLENSFAYLLENIYLALLSIGASEVFCRFLILGVFHGVASVVAFLPQTAILFFLIAVLEDSGYMARAAFVMDTTLRPFGLSGKAFFPFLLGFGCAVPAVISTVTLDKEEKKAVIDALPFIPCNAKLPILLTVIASFFENHRALIVLFIYTICLVTTIFSVWISKKENLPSSQLPLELPNFRVPNLLSIARHVKEKSRDFLIRAGTVVFLSCLLIDFLGTFTPTLQIASSGSESILAKFGTLFVPFFSPIGIDDGRLIAALGAGFFAKEMIVSTIEFLIPEGLCGVISAVEALPFLVFSFLYTPCMTTVSAIRKELGGKYAIRVFFRSFAFAYLVSSFFYAVFRIFPLHLV